MPIIVDFFTFYRVCLQPAASFVSFRVYSNRCVRHFKTEMKIQVTKAVGRQL